MQHDMIIAGFGGQGVMMIGKMLAYAGMNEGREVSWLPSYGPEMRGGTANCTVVISDDPVGSPVIQSPWALMALNLPSLDKFESMVRPGGFVFINTSLIARGAERDDVSVIEFAANDIANEMGNPKGANMIALGAFVGATEVASVAVVEDLVRHTFETKPHLIDINVKCFRRGLELGREQLAKGKAGTGEAGTTAF